MTRRPRFSSKVDEFRWKANDPTGPIASTQRTPTGGVIVTAEQRQAVLALAAETGVELRPHTRWWLQASDGGIATLEVTTDVIPARQVAIAYAQLLVSWDEGLRAGQDVFFTAMPRLKGVRSLGQLAVLGLEPTERNLLRMAFDDLVTGDIMGTGDDYGTSLTPQNPLEETLAALLSAFTDIPHASAGLRPGAAGPSLRAASGIALGQLHLVDTARALLGLPVDPPAAPARTGVWTPVVPRAGRIPDVGGY